MPFFNSILDPVPIKKVWVFVLCLGWVLSITIFVIYDREKAKTNQYQELNTFLVSRLKEISGERSKLELSLQEAITKGLNTQSKIENQHEKDGKAINQYFDTLNRDANKLFFERNYGKIGQRKIQKR